jgi:hypothetical protein
MGGIPDGAADLDDQIARVEAELAALYQRRIARDHAALLLAILAATDTWFTARELRALVPLSGPLVTHLAGASAKAIGRRLQGIAEAQDRAGSVRALRLLRHKTTTAPTEWKIET